MRTELVAACLVAALMGTTAARAQSQPTASEIFDLRTKCHELSAQLRSKWQNGFDAERQSQPNVSSLPKYYITELSRYSTSKNTCFSQLTILWEPAYNDLKMHQQVFNAQTGQTLIAIDYLTIKNQGSISDLKYLGDKYDFDNAERYRKMLMEGND